MRHSCPCCTDDLLRHINHQRVYWFCSGCKQTMPVIKQPSKEQKRN